MKPYLVAATALLCLFAAGMLATNNVQPILTGSGTGALVFPETVPSATLSASGGTLTIGAGGSNGNINLNPSGSGVVLVNGVGLPVSGFPGDYASVTLTGQTSSSGPTNIRHGGSVLPAGRYLLGMTAVNTATGTNNLTATLNWNDGAGTETMQLGPQGMGSSPARLEALQHAILNGSTDLTYTIAISGGSGGTASVWVDVTRLQ